MSFIAPVFTMFILALPLPAPKFSGGVKFALVFIVSLYAGLALLPLIIHYPVAGLLMVALALYLSFYYTAKGGSAVLGAFATVGIALVTSVGSVSIDAVLGLIGGMSIGVIAGILFVWVGHALLPDTRAEPVAVAPKVSPAEKPAEKPNLAVARLSAFRSLLIVMPILASMGQQASIDHTRQAAKSLLVSTVIGGIGAILAWQVLSIHTSLLLYVLLIVLCGLVLGPRIFKGPGMQPAGATWSYAYLTMIVILAPAVLDQQSGANAGAAFWSRLIMFMGASLYGVLAVFIFDFFSAHRQEPAGEPIAKPVK